MSKSHGGANRQREFFARSKQPTISIDPKPSARTADGHSRLDGDGGAGGGDAIRVPVRMLAEYVGLRRPD